MKKIGSIIILMSVLLTELAVGQLERRLVVETAPVEQTFMAPRNINLYTVHNLAKSELHYSIMHTFGEVHTGYQNLWGIDNGANVRFSFEYGVSDVFSLGIGRSSLDKIVDITGRYHFLRQMSDDSMPLSATFSGGIGINTSDLSFVTNLGMDEYSFSDRTNFYASVLLARKFNENLSLQVAPMVVHFNRVGTEISLTEENTNTYLAVGLSGRYKVRPRLAITAQYIPTITEKRTNDNLALGLDIETGGHVFQLFFTTSRALNDSYLIAADNGSIGDREFRFGFNVNRIFSLRR
jgi:hypothetical protein